MKLKNIWQQGMCCLLAIVLAIQSLYGSCPQGELNSQGSMAWQCWGVCGKQSPDVITFMIPDDGEWCNITGVTELDDVYDESMEKVTESGKKYFKLQFKRVKRLKNAPLGERIAYASGNCPSGGTCKIALPVEFSGDYAACSRCSYAPCSTTEPASGCASGSCAAPPPGLPQSGNAAGNGALLSAVKPVDSNVSVDIGLGGKAAGLPVGFLCLRETTPTNGVYTPKALMLSHMTNVDLQVIRNGGDNSVRQVKVMEGLVDVITNTPIKYTLNFYLAPNVGSFVSGLYTFTGSPRWSVVVENPDTSGSTSNRVRITDALGRKLDYLWRTNGWDFTNGTVNQIVCRREGLSQTNTLLCVTNEVYTGGVLAACQVQEYRIAGAIELPKQTVIGAGSVTLTNTFGYSTNGLATNSVAWNGSWERKEYNTNNLVTRLLKGFGNVAPTSDGSQVWVEEYSYDPSVVSGSGDVGNLRAEEPRRAIQKLLGQEIGRTYFVYLTNETRRIECVTAGAAWNASENLVTITKKVGDGSVFNDRVKSVSNPDGTLELNLYQLSSGGVTTNITLKGAPDGAGTNVVDGTKTIRILGACSQPLSNAVVDIASGILLESKSYSDFDDQMRPRKVSYMDGTFEWTDYGCCGPTLKTNRNGVVQSFFTDSVGRTTSALENGIVLTNTLNAAGNLLLKQRIGTNGTIITIEAASYDATGWKTSSTNAVGKVTTYSRIVTNNQTIVTTTYPDGGTRIETYFRSGRLESLKGTAVFPVRYEFGVEQVAGVWRTFQKTIKLDAAGADTSEWTKSYRDMVGRAFKTVYSDGGSNEQFYNTKGQLIKAIDADGVTTLYQFNGTGEVEYTALDADRDGVIDFNQTDRITRKVTSVTTAHGYNVVQTTTYLWATNSSTYSNVVSIAETSTDGLRSWSTSLGLTRSSVKGALVGTTYNETATEPDGTSEVETTQSGRVISKIRYDSTSAQVSKQSIYYDAHGRPFATTDARNGTTYSTYTDDDKVSSVTSPVPGSGKAAQVVSTFYESMGRVQRTVHPDGNIVTNDYFATGLLKKTYGVRSYPAEYTYDAQGRMKTMKTWQNFNANSGGATTTWSYDGYRGFMTNKTYADGKGTGYTYTSAGRLKTRTWARNLTTTYETDALGETALVLYSDGTTPNITNTFDRLGRKTETIYGGAKIQWSYDLVGKTLTETNIGGSLSTWNVVRSYDAYQRPSGFNLKLAGTSQLQQDTTYDTASRVWTLTHGSQNVTYTYHANSGLINQMTFKENTTTRMVTLSQYDFLNRLTKISSGLSASSQPWTAFEYDINAANQRTTCTMADGSYWIYEYDSFGQVKSGRRYWSDGTLVAGQQFEYSFDDIGNRTSTKQGGDANGGNLRSATYTPNTLNQYSQRTVPAGFDVIGAANAASTVTVNGNPPYRYSEYFRWEIPVSNGSAPVWQSVTNIATKSGTSETNLGNVYIPKTAEIYTYDLDGNITSDGRWTYTWDGENRLIGMEAIGTVPAGAKLKLSFEYDHQGRRIRKKVFPWTGSAYSSTASLDIKFLYDGWNLIVEANGSDALQRQYHWGIDLLGSMQAAGGVGGLLRMYDHGSAAHYYATYDGNGNVSSLVRQDTGAVAASYEYGPFGEIVKMSGTVSKTNPFRFSSKYQDDESALVYFGFRFYGPLTGTWIGRDPLEEGAGQNLYLFCSNNPVDHFDINGRIVSIFGKILSSCLKALIEDGAVRGATEYLDKTYVCGQMATLARVDPEMDLCKGYAINVDFTSYQEKPVSQLLIECMFDGLVKVGVDKINDKNEKFITEKILGNGKDAASKEIESSSKLRAYGKCRDGVPTFNISYISEFTILGKKYATTVEPAEGSFECPKAGPLAPQDCCANCPKAK